MSTAGNIRAYIEGLPLQQIFSTREVLHYGSRGAVDQVLYRMVESCFIIRLAWGLFYKSIDGKDIPSVEKIAEKKAAVFCKQIIKHGKDAAVELKIIEQGNDKTVYSVPGSSSSSFLCVQQNHRVYTKATSARRLLDGNTRAGKVIRALWEMGSQNIDQSVMKKATLRLNRNEMRTIWHAALRVPWWLARHTNRAVPKFLKKAK
ncbi:MAG: hypothetical protein C0507_05825 [Cyanobacteria bacterium PR.3.49]|jgi:hypothetical protein|nr:hypothetical protein [Cyanobacteria bacterium PR.3.49]